MSGKRRVLMCWSGGKDSCMTLHFLRQDPGVEVVGLLTTVTEQDDRIGMHGVRGELLDRQAAALGLPLERVIVPAQPSNGAYEAAMSAALKRHAAEGTRTVAFGDLFLEDIRAYRESMMGRIGVDAIFPVWGCETRAFAEAFIDFGFRAILVCIDQSALDDSFAGRMFDRDLLADLPPGVDPCGENGEFHSLVFDGPGFAVPVDVRRGARTARDRFLYCDVEASASHDSLAAALPIAKA